MRIERPTSNSGWRELELPEVRVASLHRFVAFALSERWVNPPKNLQISGAAIPDWLE
jgi:hypothetical protein